MSITYFLNKIKDRIRVDYTTLLLSVLITVIGLTSFGIGILFEKNKNINFNQKDDYLVINDIPENNTQQTNNNGMYVASKNGKMYYKNDCAAVKRIKDENKIWFRTEDEAIGFGYIKSKTCK